MLEMIVCMCVICAFMLLSINNVKSVNFEYCYFLNDYLLKQSMAILNKEKVSIEHGVSFNSMGHVNQARTIDFNNHSVIIHLGNGYATKK